VAVCCGVGVLLAVVCAPALAATAHTAYVANEGSARVTPIDTATNTAGTAIAVGSRPFGIAITPQWQAAYVTDHGSNSVTPIDTATNTAGTAIAVGSAPAWVAVTRDQGPVAAFSTRAAPPGRGEPL
jgi:YVTN family beta-propeller protein